MIKTGALLASGLGALALLGAGCGGSGSSNSGSASASGSAGGGSAAGTISTPTTTTGQGGVAGAQANLGQARANVVISGIQSTLAKQINALTNVKTTKQLNQRAKTLSQKLRHYANQVQQLNVPQRAQKPQQNLVSALQSVASDVDNIRTNAKSGNVNATMNAAMHLGSIQKLQQALQSFQHAIKKTNTNGMGVSGTGTLSTPSTTTSVGGSASTTSSTSG